MVAAIAGTTRRMSMPARAPIEKAASVQAANATPRRSNSMGARGGSRVCNPWARNGPKYQENSTLNAPAAAATVTASGASLATVQRARPKPWVQVYRKVPVSSSREVLMSAGGAVVSAEQLLERVWDEYADPFTNAVAVTVMRLRRKLGPPPLIETVTGSGYRLP